MICLILAVLVFLIDFATVYRQWLGTDLTAVLQADIFPNKIAQQCSVSIRIIIALIIPIVDYIFQYQVSRIKRVQYLRQHYGPHTSKTSLQESELYFIIFGQLYLLWFLAQTFNFINIIVQQIFFNQQIYCILNVRYGCTSRISHAISGSRVKHYGDISLQKPSCRQVSISHA